MPLDPGCTGSSPSCRRYTVLVEQSCFEYLVPQTPQTPLHVEQTRERERGGGREGEGEREREREREHDCHN